MKECMTSATRFFPLLQHGHYGTASFLVHLFPFAPAPVRSLIRQHLVASVVAMCACDALPFFHQILLLSHSALGAFIWVSRRRGSLHNPSVLVTLIDVMFKHVLVLWRNIASILETLEGKVNYACCFRQCFLPMVVTNAVFDNATCRQSINRHLQTILAETLHASVN